MATKTKAANELEKETGPVTFGMFLRVARKSLDITQVELAKILGISKASLCDIERGRQMVSPELAMKIATKAGLSKKLAVQACLQDQLKKAKIKMTVKLSA